MQGNPETQVADDFSDVTETDDLDALLDLPTPAPVDPIAALDAWLDDAA